MFFIFLLTQRHLHPADVENRPNGLTINIFIGRQGRVSIRAISYYAFEAVFLLFFSKLKHITGSSFLITIKMFFLFLSYFYYFCCIIIMGSSF